MSQLKIDRKLTSVCVSGSETVDGIEYEYMVDILKWNQTAEAIVFRAMCDEIELLREQNENLKNSLNDPSVVNAMPGGHGCCDICDTGGCCKAESEEE